MPLKSFEALIKTEIAAQRHVLRSCYPGGRRFCPDCGGRKLYAVRRERFRCKRCGAEFGDWTGRWIGQRRITAKDWLWTLKLFELEVPALRASGQLERSYPTVLGAYHVIRKSIMATSDDGMELLRGEVEADESYFGGHRKGKRGRGAAGKSIVFGVLERQGQIRVQVVPNVTAETLLNTTVKMVKRGSIIYTDKMSSYDALMFCGYRHLRVDHSKRFSRGKVYINGLEGFWSFAKARLIKHHGMSKKYFPYYLKEMEFRYNNRKKKNLFDLLLTTVCKPVADR